MLVGCNCRYRQKDELNLNLAQTKTVPKEQDFAGYSHVANGFGREKRD